MDTLFIVSYRFLGHIELVLIAVLAHKNIVLISAEVFPIPEPWPLAAIAFYLCYLCTIFNQLFNDVLE
jgi:hypothetical protein